MTQTFPTFMCKVFQWLGEWILLLKCPKYLQGSSIALMLRRKPQQSILNGTLRFLLDHIIVSINAKFSPSAAVVTSLLGLVSSVLSMRDVGLRPAIISGVPNDHFLLICSYNVVTTNRVLLRQSSLIFNSPGKKLPALHCQQARVSGNKTPSQPSCKTVVNKPA